MSTEETELTFIRCPSCRSLIPAIASRCRMCGCTLKEANGHESSGQEGGGASSSTPRPAAPNAEVRGSEHADAAGKSAESAPSKSRVRQRTMSVSGDELEAVREPSEPQQLNRFDSVTMGHGDVDADASSQDSERTESQQAEPEQADLDTRRGDQAISRSIIDRIIENVDEPEQDMLADDFDDEVVNESDSYSDESGFYRPVPDKSPSEPTGNEAAEETPSPMPSFGGRGIESTLRFKEDRKERQEQGSFSETESSVEASDESSGKKRRRRRKRKKRGASRAADNAENTRVESDDTKSGDDITTQAAEEPTTEAQAKEEKDEKVKDMESTSSNFENGTKEVAKKESVSQAVDTSRDLIGWFVNYEKNTGSATEIRAGRFFIGSEQVKPNDLVIEHESLSTPHCLIKADASEGLMVQDLMSEHGTTVRKAGSKDYQKPSEAVELSHGDWLKLGEYEVMVCVIPVAERKK